MEITAKTKLMDLLNEYPQLEEKIIQAAPAFKNLKNPILRRTVGQLATVEKVAQIGSLDEFTFINLLRREAGQAEFNKSENPAPINERPGTQVDPDWIKGDPEFVISGTELLTKGDVPLNRVNELLQQLTKGRFLLLITDFEPQPMFEALGKQSRTVYHRIDSQNSSQHLTYIK
jgi:hypothetical protein